VTLLPTVCVIGAGSSGIAAVKALHGRGFAFDCFEASDRVGGNWVFKNRNGVSAAYRSLHINTSRERMEFAPGGGWDVTTACAGHEVDSVTVAERARTTR